MALVKPIIYQVVGYQNSGKTTFLLKLIQVLKNDGFKTVTIKHHGHGGRPDVPLQKDSSKHLEAGAVAALVEGEGRLVLQADESSWSLDEQIRLMNFFQPDMILIEGHKHQAYPKILLLKDENDLSLLTKVDNIKAVIVWSNTLLELVRERLNVQTFHITEEKAVNAVSNFLKTQV
ncbi:molybdopterin-guanine dinucleotide biosynthesis protein B [Neobacillus niacini]|uniref:molybdopterin-guanine dinucleotide biosynthesis protein B n=1 Tax=Neobacillus niacini TaxID=86668 RepID=UPI00285EC4FB|nr:molybdopterin-guanine dinucleotide biosynthesis protein B [Neobacillus niacini]MDR7076631.1 molybdopterin-guanine dinucleotide biosynthesis protein B [Neobacillus niacini]